MSKSKKHITPPKLAERLLLWFLRGDLAEEVLGDLDEKFYSLLDKKSASKARRNYWLQVFQYLRPFALKAFMHQYSGQNQLIMLKHNLLISYRSFLRSRSTFLINLTGLASGLACTLLIYLWVTDELLVDKFHKKDHRLYQVMQNLMENGEVMTIPYMPGLLAEELMTHYPEVAAATTVWPPEFFGGEGYISHEESQFKALSQFVDEQFLNIMSFPLVQGDSKTALKDKKNVLISESLAIKLFGSTENTVGKTLQWHEGKTSGDFLITAIFKDVPKNSTMQFDMLMHSQLMMESDKYMKFWGNSNPYVFVQLKEGATAQQLDTKIEKLIQEKAEDSESILFLQKFSDRYLHGSYKNGVLSGGRIAYVRLFSLVALITLVIACINFMNLSTARAAGRLKEIGVKKALGVKRKTLIAQYYTESFVITMFSACIALLAAYLLLPQFNALTGKSLSIQINMELVSMAALIVLTAGFLAGSYPALYLSGLKTTESLKGKMIRKFSDTYSRKALVIFQFSISIIMIVGVLITSKQIDYIQSKNLGYERDNVIQFPNTGLEKTNYESFLTSLEAIPGVLSTSSADHDLTGEHGQTSDINWTGQLPDQRIDFINLEMSSGFIETMGMEMVLGRSFDRSRPNERRSIVFNETAIAQMGIEDPIGKTVHLWGNKKTIIGVVKDFHSQSLYEPIQPTFIQAYPILNNTLVKIQAGTEPETLEQIETSFDGFSNGLPFDFRFIDNDYQAMYQSEKRVATLSEYFAFIAILISCLGLLGLTAHTAEKRSKEIGIRKVLGSGIWKIILLLSGDLTKMVLASLVIGLPISYFVAQQWLQNFAFSISLDLWYFLIAGAFVIAIAWLTVGFQTLKAARANPVDSLRSE